MKRKIGAEYLGNNKTKFTVWAPLKNNVELLVNEKEKHSLIKDSKGYWEKELDGIPPGTLYKFKLEEDNVFPDPASRLQPKGVHAWSQVVNSKDFQWNDDSWKGIPLQKMIIYELHVGTFTKEGTFEAIINRLDHLLDLGINTIEIMPVSQFPGGRNWGYDGVYPFAPQLSYGGAKGLKKLINTCHHRGIAVLLDVVYNHMGPEGNYLSQYGPYFTEKYHTPWGSALNFDDEYSDEVRNFFIQNALMWLEEYHIDGLRLDAIHEIIDRGARHFLKELSEQVDELERETGRNYILIAESDLNDTKIINTYEKGGFGLEGQWVDDFHHSVHTLLTGESEGYYKDYGNIEHFAKSYKQAFIYDGKYSAFRKKTVGNNPAGLPKSQFVVSIQNHDQVGNRMLGERLTDLVSFEKLKLAAGILLTSPYIPMLFMGEEFAEKRPFQYFISHTDADLVKAVQEGRKREFEYFFNDKGEFPDPQSSETFNGSKLDWDFKEEDEKNIIFKFYKELIKLRKENTFEALNENNLIFEENEEELYFTVQTRDKDPLLIIFNFSNEPLELDLPEVASQWKTILASADKKWNGPAKFPDEFKSKERITIAATSFIIWKG